MKLKVDKKTITTWSKLLQWLGIERQMLTWTEELEWAHNHAQGNGAANAINKMRPWLTVSTMCV